MLNHFVAREFLADADVSVISDDLRETFAVRIGRSVLPEVFAEWCEQAFPPQARKT